jgi:hypothetical protein
MDKKTKKTLIIGGIAAAAAAGWYFFFGPGATPAAAVSLPASGPVSPVAANQPVSNSTAPWFLPSNSALVAYITPWINSTSPRQQVGLIQYLTTKATQQDITNLAAMIAAFNGGPAASAALSNWWNTFSTTDTGFNGS